jgi:hypothetical protein
VSTVDSIADKGDAPTNAEPGGAGDRPKKQSGGLNPFVVIGITLACGIALAKLVDRRGHVHPRR